LTGSLSGVLGENVNQGSAKGTTTFSKSGGEQDTLTTFYNPLTGHAETGPSLVVGLSETKYEEKVEIKA
jgi:hypothetical protein